jgi:transposase, IS30 family
VTRSVPCHKVNANGGRKEYRALAANPGGVSAGATTQAGQARPVSTPPRGRRAQARGQWSPEQISAWLASQYPDHPEMQVSRGTVYQSLFVQSRGALRKELHWCMHSGRRAMRRAKGYTKGGVGQGKIRNVVMISERRVPRLSHRGRRVLADGVLEAVAGDPLRRDAVVDRTVVLAKG